ncbi:MAG: hypothetical protein SFU86_16150 [Pirellulaceae bacterium]|nr:hypothetical protein [Pirellulaceae bacterium]
MNSPRLARWSLVAAALVALAWPALAAPNLTDVSPRGLTIGQTTKIVLTGSDLDADTRLLLPAKIAAQSLVGPARPNRLEIEVTLDPATPPGLYPVRVANGKGVSGILLLGVDSLPQLPFAPQVERQPVALHGQVGAAMVLRSTLSGKKGQRVVLDVESQRLGGGLRPVIRLYDPRGAQIAWSPPRRALGGDARCEVQLPADGDYVIELHDELFKPAGNGFFRLKVGDLQYADFALPLAVAAGGKQAIRLPGSPLAGEAEFDASAAIVPGEVAAPLPAAPAFTGAAPRLAISDFPELLEAAPASQPQELPAAPVGISGVLGAKGEEDKFLLAVMPGQKLQFSVVARQIGSPLDGELFLRNDKGGQIAYGDDRPGSADPLVDFTVPAGLTKLQIALRDRVGDGGPDFVYRIAVREQTRPEFSLQIPTDRFVVPAGGTLVVPVQVIRAGYGGPISLALENGPAEVQLGGGLIPAGATTALVTLSAQNVSPQAVLTRLIGQADEAKAATYRAATFAEFPGAKHQPRLREQFALAIAVPSPISLAWNAGADDKLLVGGKLAANLRIARMGNVPGNVRVRLLTTQPTPTKKINDGKAEKTVDDPDRMLRLEGEATFPPDQSDVSVNILVPADLPLKPWDLVLAADLLAKDGKSVVTSIAAPLRTLPTALPFSIELAGSAAADGKAGAGETGKLAGKVLRAAGYAQPVAITLEGLPKGVAAPQVIVPADQTDFALPVRFTYGTKAGPLKGVKLVGLSAPITAGSVRSNALEVAINVVPGEKPASEMPKEIYEDDEAFIALLTEGAARAVPDQRETHSGKYALRIVGDERRAATLPGLGVKIRENPGPGEYRYLRFAWKKAGGNAICLQLAKDGQFGAASPPAATFRYHAGPGAPSHGGALVLDDQLPAKFELVTRDLFADFGEFTLTGLGFSAIDGQSALFDHLYLARQLDDFELLKEGPAK